MLCEFKGIMCRVELYNDKIIIYGKHTKMNRKIENEIYLSNITGIKIEKPSLVQGGYIKFLVSGYHEKNNEKWSDQYYDENLIHFNGAEKYQEALAFKRLVEKVRFNQSTQSIKKDQTIQSASVADELLKLKKLWDAGVLTEEEFLMEKQKLLRNNDTNLNSISNDVTRTDFYKDKLEPTKRVEDKKCNNKKDFYKVSIIVFLVVILLICVVQCVGNSESDTDNITTLTTVEKWYEDNISDVSSALIDYANDTEGISEINITSRRFRFGQLMDIYECHYTYCFECKIDGVECSGEARAFRKYNDDTITWFHFEIFRVADGLSVIEEYDETYDQIINDYYLELCKLYK